MKKITLIIVLIAVFVAGIFVFTKRTPLDQSPTPLRADNGHKNIAYLIEGRQILLKDGAAETDAAPGSVEKVDTNYFGNEVKGDFNNDGFPDVAFILTQSGGGTGVFYYVVVALKVGDAYLGTNAIYLGDRIAPQSTEYRNGQLIVNYADRKPDEPFSAEPTVGVTKLLKVSAGDKLIEIP